VLLLWMGRDRAAPLAVLGGWLATTLIFITVDLAYGLIVRHFYFALPLACVAAALSLSHAAAWKPWMRPVVWLLVAAYCVSGVLLWVAATAAYAKPSMTPLTH
jgi:hypothetical protein